MPRDGVKVGDGIEGDIQIKGGGSPQNRLSPDRATCGEGAQRGREASRSAAAPARGQRLHRGQREAPGGQSGQWYLIQGFRV